MLALTCMLLLVVELGWAAQCNKWYGPATITNTSGGRAWRMHTSSKRANKNTIVQTELQLIAGISVCLKCIARKMDQWRVIVPVLPAIQPHIQTLSRLPHYCLQSAIVHQGIPVIGIATAWRESILVKLQVMDMQSNTLNIFASCLTKPLQNSVKSGKTGLMEFTNASKSHWCHYWGHGSIQPVKRYEKERLPFIHHVTWIQEMVRCPSVISTAPITSRSFGSSRVPLSKSTHSGNLSKECGT